MRREDLLKALFIRFVDPQQQEQDWVMLAALFYSLTRLLLPSQRVEQLYYQYIHSYGGRTEMELACKEYEVQLTLTLRQYIANTQSLNNSVAKGNRHVNSSSVTTPRKTNTILSPVTSNITPSLSGLATNVNNINNNSSNNSNIIRSGNINIGDTNMDGSLAGIFSSSPQIKEEGDDDGSFGKPAVFQQLTTEQREHWRRLRQEPISPDTLIQLVQQFSLVRSAGVFLSPVDSSTVMEFNGARSDPYSTVIMYPVSLWSIRTRIIAARRDYELHKPQVETIPLTNSSSYNNNNNNNNIEVGVATRKRGRTPSNSGIITGGNNNNSSSRETANSNIPNYDDKGGIRTIQELEQAVWHIAANCVVFNAPESYYPSTARQFAYACTNIIEEFCMQCILGE